MDAVSARAERDMQIELPEAAAKRGGSRVFARRIVPALQAYLAGFLTLSASLANFLIHQDYPLLRIEVAAAFALLAAFCLLPTLVYLAMSWRLRAALEAMLVLLLVDLNFSGPGVAFALAMVVLAALLFLKKSLVGPLSVFGAIVLAATLAGAGGADPWLRDVQTSDRAAALPAAAQAAGRPAIVHVLLDEHQGLGGFPRDTAGRQVSAELRDFYTGRGFRIFPRAYSRHMHTINAVPDVLNFGTGGPVSSDQNSMEVGPTRYFDRLRELGYAMSIYQSDFGEFCSGVKAARCVEYDSASMAPMARYDFTTGERLQVMIAKFVTLAQSLRAAESLYIKYFAKRIDAGADPLPPPSFANKSSAVATMLFFDRLESDLADLRPGQAVFVHALFPHYPYVTGSDCRIKPVAQWRHRRDWTAQASRQKSYYEQVRCTAKVVDRLMAALDRSPVAGNYALVIHGDHGSRITASDPLAGSAKIADADMLAGFSTLFAVKLPGSTGSTDNAIAPISELLRSLALNEYQQFPATNSTSSPSVVLDDVEWRPREKRSLPVDW